MRSWGASGDRLSRGSAGPERRALDHRAGAAGGQLHFSRPPQLHAWSSFRSGRRYSIAAEARYAVYVNGRYVGSGPARGTHYRYFYDSYEVGALLVAGRNTVAARVHCPLTGTTGTVPPVLPALIAQIEPFVATDAAWEVSADPAHRSDALFYTHHIGYSEYRDLRRDPEGWEVGTDRFSGWQGARELCAAGARLGGRALTARDIPPLTERHFRPARIVATGAVPLHRAGIEEDVDYAGLMQVEMHLGLSHRLFRRSMA